ncbi:MAG TPA: CBS domain-containing protein [Candidatus Binataceae bacterium]|nr:CBS domain-containing protein [Candidatus Binataceae bacterium]
MALADEDIERLFDEECPGPADLGSVLVNDPIRNAANYPPLIVDAETHLSEVLRKMREAGRGAVLIVKDNRLTGIFTERDVLLRIAGFPIDVERTAVGEHMTPDPHTLPADSSVAFALNKMVVEGFRHVPLVDEQGRPTGMVSMRDLIDYLSDFFSKDVLNLPPDPRGGFSNRDGA